MLLTSLTCNIYRIYRFMQLLALASRVIIVFIHQKIFLSLQKTILIIYDSHLYRLLLLVDYIYVDIGL